MKSREHIRKILNKEHVRHCGFWLGKPHPDTERMLNEYLGTKNLDEIQLRFNDDIRWINPQSFPSTYMHPEGKSMRPWKDKNPHGLSGQGLLSLSSSLDDLAEIDFPEVEYLDFTETIAVLEKTGDYYRLSGFWSAFYHDLTYLFGTEELLILMLIKPEIVKEALNRICGFYYEANEKFFKKSSGLADALFIGNDFGTQNGLLFSPQHFSEFFLPWIEKFAAQAHRFGLHFILHSCGGVADIIDVLIDAGVDCLHPLQTTARGMNVSELSAMYNDKITFMGGVDTQDLLLNGTVTEIDDAVEKLLNKFGTGFILGPSHEALLPSVKTENVIRMAEHPRFIEN